MIIIPSLARLRPVKNLTLCGTNRLLLSPLQRPSNCIAHQIRHLSSKDKDRFEYKVRFKQDEVKQMFKKFYKLYGPLFVGCHITISLISLGFFCTLVWFSIDPIEHMPDWLKEQVGQRMMSMSSGGGKFIVAYAVHKLILPIRLGSAIGLTRYLANRLKTLQK